MPPVATAPTEAAEGKHPDGGGDATAAPAGPHACLILLHCIKRDEVLMRLPPGWARDMPRRRAYARCPLVGLDPRNYSAPNEAEFYSKKQRGGASGVSPLLCVEIISDNKQRTGTTASNSEIFVKRFSSNRIPRIMSYRIAAPIERT